MKADHMLWMCRFLLKNLLNSKGGGAAFMLALSLAALMLRSISVCAGESKSRVQLQPNEDVGSIVAASSSGTTFVFAPGTYRMAAILPKDHDTFIGNGAVLDGAKVLAMYPDGRGWSVLQDRAAWGPGHCAKDHPQCWILNDLFIDGTLQVMADSIANTGPGKWFYDDASKKVYISVNPAGHTVEFSEATAAFSGKARDVTIQHLRIEKYASPPQSGAVGGRDRPQNWIVQDTVVEWNHGAGIFFGSYASIEHCSVNHNGQEGVGGTGPGSSVINNEIAYNNYAGYDPAWEAGGTKFAGTDNLQVSGNNVHDNQGHGLWTDTDNIHSIIENNTVMNNLGTGILHEISYKAIIRNNLVTGNGRGIVVALSPDVDVYGNVIEVPLQGTVGIRIADGLRGSGMYGSHVAQNDHVHDNIITYLGSAGNSGFSGVVNDSNNITFDSNHYRIPGGGQLHWTWGNGKTFIGMQQLNVERHGTISVTAPPVRDPTLKPPTN